MPIPIRIVYCQDLAEAYATLVATQMEFLTRKAADPGSMTGPSVGAHDGKTAFLMTANDDLDIIIVAGDQPSGATVPVRYFLSQAGSQQFVSFRCNGAATTDDFQATLTDWIFNYKETVIDLCTDGVPSTPTWTFGLAASGRSTRALQVIMVEGLSQTFCTQSGWATTDEVTAPPDTSEDTTVTSLPDSPVQQGAQNFSILAQSIDLTETNNLLKDIALRDFTVRFNHGAQQFSAEGGVAIP